MQAESHKRPNEDFLFHPEHDFGLAFAAFDYEITCQLDALERRWMSPRARVVEIRQTARSSQNNSFGSK